MSSTSGSPVVPSGSPLAAVAAPSGASGADAWAAATAATAMFSCPSAFCRENDLKLLEQTLLLTTWQACSQNIPLHELNNNSRICSAAALAVSFAVEVGGLAQQKQELALIHSTVQLAQLHEWMRTLAFAASAFAFLNTFLARLPLGSPSGLSGSLPSLKDSDLSLFYPYSSATNVLSFRSMYRERTF